ncbi:Pre-mRNA processing factor 4, partial [Nannochloropsis gaditana]
MEALKAELARKKQEKMAMVASSGSNGNGEEGGKKGATQAKYIRQGDVMKAEAQRRALEQAKRDKEREDARRQRIEDESAAQGSLQARLGQKAADWALNKERRKVSGEGAGGMATEGRKEEGKEGEGGNNAGGQGEGIKALRELPLQEVQKRLRALGKPITLYAEDMEERLERLMAAEAEEREKGVGTEDDFGLAGGFETVRRGG